MTLDKILKSNVTMVTVSTAPELSTPSAFGVAVPGGTFVGIDVVPSNIEGMRRQGSGHRNITQNDIIMYTTFQLPILEHKMILFCRQILSGNNYNTVTVLGN